MLTSFQIPQPLTRFTESATSVHAGILCGKKVPTFTGNFTGEWAAPDVDVVGNGFKVIRVNTVTDSAFVVYLQTFRDRTYKHFVGDTMRHCVFVVVETLAVSFLVKKSLPQPAAICFKDLSPKHKLRIRKSGYDAVVVAGTATVGALKITGSKRFLADGANSVWSCSGSSHTTSVSEFDGVNQ